MGITKWGGDTSPTFPKTDKDPLATRSRIVLEINSEKALHRCRKDQVLQLASKVHYNMCQATVWRVFFAAVYLTMQIVTDEAGMI